MTKIKKEINEQLLDFIDRGVTSFHVIENMKEMLLHEGYIRLYEEQNSANTDLIPGGRYFIIRNDSALIAFSLPKDEIKGFHIAASHSDSPCFKLKEQPEITVENQYRKLNVEKYGGMILSTWLDRPLGVAGRVIVKEENKFVSKLVDLGPDFCVIPNLSIHFNREINKGYEYNPQVDMQPLFSGDGNCSIEKKIAEMINKQPSEILGSDLYLYQGEKGRSFGADKEYLLAPRLDDLQCVFTTMEGFLQSTPKDYTNVLAVFDNEEVGSRTRQGADSDFLKNVLKRIADAYPKKDLAALFADSFLISADNAHGLHPNHPEKSDVSNHPFLNQGIVLKFHGSAQYTTDGYSAAVIRDLCSRAGITVQTFTNRSDVAGGSTLGNIAVSQESIPAADIGIAQLSMHSAMETAGAQDTEDMIKLITEFMNE